MAAYIACHIVTSSLYVDGPDVAVLGGRETAERSVAQWLLVCIRGIHYGSTVSDYVTCSLRYTQQRKKGIYGQIYALQHSPICST